MSDNVDTSVDVSTSADVSIDNYETEDPMVTLMKFRSYYTTSPLTEYQYQVLDFICTCESIKFKVLEYACSINDIRMLEKIIATFEQDNAYRTRVLLAESHCIITAARKLNVRFVKCLVYCYLLGNIKLDLDVLDDPVNDEVFIRYLAALPYLQYVEVFKMIVILNNTRLLRYAVVNNPSFKRPVLTYAYGFLCEISQYCNIDILIILIQYQYIPSFQVESRISKLLDNGLEMRCLTTKQLDFYTDLLHNRKEEAFCSLMLNKHVIPRDLIFKEIIPYMGYD